MSKLASRAAVLALLACCAPGAAAQEPSSWSPVTRKKIVVDALKVAPPALARLMIRHGDSLMAGLEDARAAGTRLQHAQPGNAPDSGAAAALEFTSGWAVEAMDGHARIAAVVYRMGVLAHYAMDVSDPILASPQGAAAGFSADFARYVERNLSRFPVLFYGYPDLSATDAAGPPAAADLATQGIDEARKARSYYPALRSAYAAAGGSSSGFDVRSIPFGIASICYSRAVTNVARAWLSTWRAARGDISGTPYLNGAPPLPEGFRIAFRRARPAGSVPGFRSVDVRPPPAEATAADAVTATEPQGGSAAPITKTIYGKSRRRKAEKESAGRNKEAGGKAQAEDDGKP